MARRDWAITHVSTRHEAAEVVLQLALINFLVHAVSTPEVTDCRSQWQMVPRVNGYLKRARMRSTDQSPAVDVNEDSGDG